jgi:hydrogenase expression/formation protein HypD
VTFEGNRPAQEAIARVFAPCDRSWRGIGEIPASGWRLADEFAALDAERRFDVGAVTARESELCRSGLVLTGRLRPGDCPAFGRQCTPEHPLGATMVSSEGACAAWWRYRRPVGAPEPLP